MEYKLKDDLIKEYASKRKGLDEADVKDLLDCMIGYFNKELGAFNSREVAYRLNNFGVLYDLDFDTSKLLKEEGTVERDRTEKQLVEYILTNGITPKKLSIKDDKILRT